MIYKEFQGKQLSNLGFGCMRLPLIEGTQDIDEVKVQDMVLYAATHGVNYFDTAFPYHNGMSEIVIGKALKALPRDSYYLATKYPGHQIAESYDPAEIFEEQLKKCDVDYFDFYLLHNVYEDSVKVYMDPKWGIVDYFVEQKKLGRIKHLGFSCHALPDTLDMFLDKYGDVMEFCQIQLNYLDWTLQDAKRKYDSLTKRGIPVWVMESIRGGKLAALDEASHNRLQQLRPECSDASWALRFLQGLPNVTMILSGMSNMEQMIDNVHTFEDVQPLSPAEIKVLFEIAEGMKDSVPCTSCRYCCKGCPKDLDIPELIALYNDMRFSQNLMTAINIEGMSAEKRPSACIGCGKCARTCPQKIDVPAVMKDFVNKLSQFPSWAEISRQRAEAAEKLRKK